MKKILILLFFIVVPNTTIAQNGEELMEIYYIPLGVSTYTPVTKDTITDESVYATMELNHPGSICLKDILQSAKIEHEFSDYNVRMKIIFGKEEVFYVDNYAGVSIDGKNDRKLSESQLMSFKKILHNLSKGKMGIHEWEKSESIRKQ